MKPWFIKKINKKSCLVIWGLKTSFLYEVCWNAKYFPSSDASSISTYLAPARGPSVLAPGTTGTTCMNHNLQEQSGSTETMWLHVQVLSLSGSDCWESCRNITFRLKPHTRQKAHEEQIPWGERWWRPGSRCIKWVFNLEQCMCHHIYFFFMLEEAASVSIQPYWIGLQFPW